MMERNPPSPVPVISSISLLFLLIDVPARYFFLLANIYSEPLRPPPPSGEKKVSELSLSHTHTYTHTHAQSLVCFFTGQPRYNSPISQLHNLFNLSDISNPQNDYLSIFARSLPMPSRVTPTGAPIECRERIGGSSSGSNM
jgi:hypothetical protein